MRAHIGEFRLVAMCRVLGVHRSGYYAWVRQSLSRREREDQRLLGLIKHSWLASGGVYGHRKITLDLREAGECQATPSFTHYGDTQIYAPRVWLRISCGGCRAWLRGL